MAEVMTGRVMVQGQLVMVRVVAFLGGLGQRERSIWCLGGEREEGRHAVG